MTTTRSFTLFFALATTTWLLACDDTVAAPDTSAIDPDAGDVQTDEDGQIIPSDPWAVGAETDDWKVLFNYRGRLPTTQDDNELWFMEPDGSGQRTLTDLAGLNSEDPPLSCNYGCIVSRDLKWIAIATGPPSADGFELKLGKFNADYEVAVFKGLTLTGIIDFKFAGDRIFYSQKGTCEGASCQYELYVVDLAVNVNNHSKFLDFPPSDLLEGSTYKGHFKVSEDGNDIVMLHTTIRSVAVYLWRDGTGLVKLDFICKYGTEADCTGTGSEYNDTDPVAISPDNRYIVFFTFSDRWQHARIYDTNNPDQVQLSIIASVPSGLYIEKVCDPGNLAEWQWQRIRADPVFTPDGEEIVFLTETNCTDDGMPPDKPRTNLRRVKLATLLSGKTLEEADVYNVTKSPKGNVTANKRVTAFTLAPDGATVVFSATPTYDQHGDLIGDGTARQRNDREVYRMRLDGENMSQLTNNLGYRAEAPKLVTPAQ